MSVSSTLLPPAPASRGVRPIRVVLADDHRITLWGLQRLIDASRPRMEVAGTATCRRELLEHWALSEADVIVLDLDLGGEDAAGVMAELQRRSRSHVLILTGSDDAEQHRAAVLEGARGVLHKSESADTILQAIEKVHAGEVWLAPGLLGEVLGRLTGRRSEPCKADPHAERIASLTPREREIVAALVAHAGAKQLVLADALGMSEHTLRNHLTTIYSKLQVRGRLELHLYATAHGLAGPGEKR